jgi:hypothetical protein
MIQSIISIQLFMVRCGSDQPLVTVVTFEEGWSYLGSTGNSKSYNYSGSVCGSTLSFLYVFSYCQLSVVYGAGEEALADRRRTAPYLHYRLENVFSPCNSM